MIKVSWILVIFFTLTSCISNKKLIYLQGDQFSADHSTLMKNERPEYKVQTNDILSVSIQTPQQEISNLFNTSSGRTGGGTFSDAASQYLLGYHIDDAGNIVLPTIGKMYVKNLTIHSIQELIQNKANEFLNSATVKVTLVSYKVTVLGNVTRPGYYYLHNNQASILEVLGVAGDINSFGSRKNIKLIRQTPEGSEVILLDITDPNIIKNRYFYILPNDVIYVEPLKAQATRSNLGTLGIVFAGISTIVLILNYLNVK